MNITAAATIPRKFITLKASVQYVESEEQGTEKMTRSLCLASRAQTFFWIFSVLCYTPGRCSDSDRTAVRQGLEVNIDHGLALSPRRFSSTRFTANSGEDLPQYCRALAGDTRCDQHAFRATTLAERLVRSTESSGLRTPQQYEHATVSDVTAISQHIGGLQTLHDPVSTTPTTFHTVERQINIASQQAIIGRRGDDDAQPREDDKKKETAKATPSGKTENAHIARQMSSAETKVLIILGCLFAWLVFVSAIALSRHCWLGRKLRREQEMEKHSQVLRSHNLHTFTDGMIPEESDRSSSSHTNRSTTTPWYRRGLPGFDKLRGHKCDTEQCRDGTTQSAQMKQWCARLMPLIWKPKQKRPKPNLFYDLPVMESFADDDPSALVPRPVMINANPFSRPPHNDGVAERSVSTGNSHGRKDILESRKARATQVHYDEEVIIVEN